MEFKKLSTQSLLNRLELPEGKINMVLDNDHVAWSKVIWDIAAVAYVVNPSWVPTNLVHSPILTDQMTWSVDQSRHFIKVAVSVDRDQIFKDLFSKI